MQAVVAGLHVYPLKSARGIALERSDVFVTGLAHDRQLMVVDDDGRFVTQRSVPRLARIGTALEPEGIRLWLDAADGPREHLLIPFRGPAPRITTSLWRSTCEGDLVEAATAWISEVCERSARIVRFAGERTVNPGYGAPEDRVMHADGYAVLVVNEASRAALEHEVGAAVPMDRFRANVVLEGWPAWREDDVEELHLGAVRLHLVKPCGRCAVVNLDQRTGARSREPLATLARIRRDTLPHRRLLAHEDATALIPFGENASVRAPGLLSKGMSVEARLRAR